MYRNFFWVVPSTEICKLSFLAHISRSKSFSSIRPPMKKITHFFLICSGANLRMLEECPSERTKYAGLGATVFFTGFFAFLSAAFALYTVFNSYWIAIALGLVWGLMIFNLDRYIVSGMRKEGRPGREFVNALPRLVLAVLISIVIAKPLELRIFDKEIQPELVIMEQQVFAKQEEEVRGRFSLADSKIRADVAALLAEIKEKAIKRDELRRIAQEEADGTGGSKRRNLGPIYKVKKADADRAEEELSKLQVENSAKMAALQKELTANDSLMNQALHSLQYAKRDGLAARMEALSRLKENSVPTTWASWFIMLLIIALETAPVFVKLISSKGPYDNLLKGEEFRFFTRETREVSEASSELRRKTKDWPEQEDSFANGRLDQALKKV
jgi:hypothetical protein